MQKSLQDACRELKIPFCFYLKSVKTGLTKITNVYFKKKKENLIFYK